MNAKRNAEKAAKTVNSAVIMNVPLPPKGKALLLKYNAGVRIARTGAVKELFWLLPAGSEG